MGGRGCRDKSFSAFCLRGLPSPPSLVSPSWFLQLRPLIPSNLVCTASCPPHHSGPQRHGINCLSLLLPGPAGGRSGPRHRRPGKCPQSASHALPSASPTPGAHPSRNHCAPISQREQLRLERRLICPSSHREANWLIHLPSPGWKPPLLVPGMIPCSAPSPTTLVSF